MKLYRSVQLVLLTVLFLVNLPKSNAQTISPRYFGVNAWMPDTIGDVNNCTDPPCIKYGKLHKHWAKVKDSKAMSVRYGGIAPDKNKPTNFQYIRMIDSIRSKGMEPIVQVPFYNFRYTAQQAANIVYYINVTRGKAVKYWIIGNEPNLSYGYTTSAQVAAYFKQFASAMKNVDSTIKIIGPETASFKKTILDGLTNPGGPDDITGKDAAGRYYLDVYSFHTYPFGNESVTLPTRSQLTSKLTAVGSFQDNLVYLNSRLAAANSYHNRTGSNALKAAVTEANVNYTNHPTDNLYGVGANSFLGGQFVAELYGIGLKQGLEMINLWSVIEGGSSVENNCGFLDGSTGNKKPLFYHFKLLAENFKGSSVNATSSQFNVKTFASKSSSQVTVLLMNEDATVNHPFTVRLNSTVFTSTSTLKVNVNAGLNAADYSDVLPNQTSMLLTFNSSGVITKKCVYSMTVQAAANQPPACTDFATPDLTVSSNSISSPSVVAGGSVTVNSTVLNTGTGNAATSAVGYYLSPDNAYSSSDVLLSTSAINTLSAGGSQAKQTVVTIPVTTASGNYFLLHKADYNNTVAESNETNNLAFNSLTVGNAAVTDVSALSPGTSTAAISPSGSLTANFTIKNSGTSSLNSVNAGFYLSTDTTWSTSDNLLTAGVTGPLAPGATTVLTKTLTVPPGTLPGSYYILFFADNTMAISEANENNNLRYKAVSLSKSIDVITTSPTVLPSEIIPGGIITANCILRNFGGDSSPASTLGYYLSTDSLWDINDHFLASASFNPLGPGGTTAKTTSVSIPSSVLSGNYYLLFFADNSNLIAETSEANNINAIPLRVNNVTGIGENEKMKDWKEINIYPNPTNGPLSIELAGPGNQEYNVEVYDISGNRVFKSEMLFTDNKLEFILPDHLLKGLYILTISRGEERVTRKIILNR
jgi:uncharacterized membrane protein